MDDRLKKVTQKLTFAFYLFYVYYLLSLFLVANISKDIVNTMVYLLFLWGIPFIIITLTSFVLIMYLYFKLDSKKKIIPVVIKTLVMVGLANLPFYFFNNDMADLITRITVSQ